MAFALVYGGVVVQLADATFPVHDSMAWVDMTSVTPTPAVGWTCDGTIFTAPAPVAPPTLPQQAQALLATGLAVTSMGTPTLNATYPADAATQQKVASIELRLAAGLGFPGGVATLPWKDITGAWHAMTPAAFAAFANALSSFVAACDLVIDGYPGAALPTAAATIA